MAGTWQGSGIMSQTQILYNLQQLDNEIREKKLRLGEVLRAQKEPQSLIDARQQAEKLESQLHAQRGRHKDLTLELGSVNDKARRSEQRLYSGDVKNPKELTDLQHEIESLGRRRDVLETEALEALIATEDLEEKRQAAQAQLDEMAAGWELSVESLKKEQQKLAMRLVQLGQLRDQQAAKVTPKLLGTYDQMAQRKSGVAVAALQGGKCLGCQVTVPAHRVKDVEEGKLVYCDNCGRILCPI